ncbi:MAG: hypothetical protein O2930_09530 [Acidobacteria bacterium]|nr:hypothetical protein [Acidobacteriota bacterium]
MSHQRKGVSVAFAAVVAVSLLMPFEVAGQAPVAEAGAFTPPRTADGQPDLQGFWRVTPNGSYNIQDLEMHSIFQQGRPNPDVRGMSRIVDPADGTLPYQAWAAAKAKEIFDTHTDPTPETINPDARCFMQGVPHHLYNREIEIFQTSDSVAIFNMAHHTFRVIPLDGRPHIPEPIKLWMGDSVGRWEDDALVVEVTNHNDQTRFDVVADFHSDVMRVDERFVLIDPDTIQYTATIEDPKVFTRPWTMAFRLVRDKEYGDELWEEACYEGNARTLELMLNRPGR